MSEASAKRIPAAHLVEVDASHAGQRIDNFLATRLKGVPKSHIYRLLRRGEVRVNRGRIRPEYRLQMGDRVRIPPVRQGEEHPGALPQSWVLHEVERRIIYEDADLLVLDKPAGLAVHGGSGVSYGVIEALRALRPTAPFLELVHRLDRDTSGCLIVAKRRSALRRLHDLLREGGVGKRYLALLRGTWHGGARRVEAALRKNLLQSGERMVRVSGEGKEAVSLFRPVRVFSDATLVEVDLLTGRTHQIRVHAAHIGHPVAGDEKYGDAAFNRSMATLGLRRLFLHAETVSFHLPERDRALRISAPLDRALAQVLSALAAPARRRGSGREHSG